MHILWQKRISEGDEESTPYWYPFQTNGGAMRADRLAFPIPPGTHWSEVEAVEVPMVDADGKTVLALPPVGEEGSTEGEAEAPTPTAPAMEKVGDGDGDDRWEDEDDRAAGERDAVRRRDRPGR